MTKPDALERLRKLAGDYDSVGRRRLVVIACAEVIQEPACLACIHRSCIVQRDGATRLLSVVGKIG